MTEVKRAMDIQECRTATLDEVDAALVEAMERDMAVPPANPYFSEAVLIYRRIRATVLDRTDD